jgi:uncharacterized membrane protein
MRLATVLLPTLPREERRRVTLHGESTGSVVGDGVDATFCSVRTAQLPSAVC